MNVLVVDEDHASAATLSGMLNRWGYEVFVINSAKAALDHLMISSAGSQIVIAN